MFGLFSNKKRVEQVKEDTRKGFESVKKDIASVSGWIKHLDSEKNMHSKDIEEIKSILSSVQTEIEGLKNVLSIMNELKPTQVFKRLSKTSTPVQGVATPVETPVYTPKLDQFSMTERAILWVLLNSDMKLSYEDIAAVLGKEKSTIRSQLSHIKRKSGLVEEVIEQSGKKRVFIPENMKQKLLKKSKVRIKKPEKAKKKQKISTY